MKLNLSIVLAIVFIIGVSVAILLISGFKDMPKIGILSMGAIGFAGGIIGYQLGKNHHYRNNKSTGSRK